MNALHRGQITRRKSAFTIAFLLILLVCSLLISCSSKPEQAKLLYTYPLDSLNNLIVENLRSKQIVMVGDGLRGHIHYMETITSSLHSWIEKVTATPNDPALPRHITLFLEMDDDGGRACNQFFSTGNLDSLMSYWTDLYMKYGTPILTVDYFQFMNELREIKLQIAELNQKYPELHLDLKIAGCDADLPYSFSEILAMSREEYAKKDIWWVQRVRDRVSSVKITTQLLTDPGSKGIVFCTFNRLSRVPFDVDNPNGGPKEQQYLLAHYLDSIFLRGKVATFQVQQSQQLTKDNNGANFVQAYSTTPLTHDYLIGSVLSPPAPRLLLFNTNKQLLSVISSGMQNHSQGGNFADSQLTGRYISLFRQVLEHSYLALDKSRLNELQKVFTYRIRSRKNTITMNNVLQIVEKTANDFDAIKNITNFDDWLLKIENPDDRYYDVMIRTVLKSLPESTSVQRPGYRFTNVLESNLPLSDSEKQVIRERIEELKFYSLVNLLWLGSADERAAAKLSLQEMTGLSHEVPSAWQKWFEEKYRGK